MIMPFGKFKGELIEDLPSWYLKWIAENIKEDSPVNTQICTEADAEYQYREKFNLHETF